MDGLIHLLIVLSVLIVGWLVVQRALPDPLITKIAQIIIFVVAVIVVLRMVLPLAGVSF